MGKKSNLHSICSITQKRVTSGGAHLRGLAQHNSEETSQWRVAGDSVSNSTDPGINPHTSRTDVSDHYANCRGIKNMAEV